MTLKPVLVFCTVSQCRSQKALAVFFEVVAKRLLRSTGVAIECACDDSGHILVAGRSIWSLRKQLAGSFFFGGDVFGLWLLLRFPLIRFCWRLRNSIENDVRYDREDVGFRLHGRCLPAENDFIVVKAVKGCIYSTSDIVSYDHCQMPLVELRVPSFLCVANSVMKIAARTTVELQAFPPAMRGRSVRVEGDVLPCRAVGIYMKVIRNLCGGDLPFDFFDNVMWQSPKLRQLLRAASKDCKVILIRFSRCEAVATCRFEARRENETVKKCIQAGDDSFLGKVICELRTWIKDPEEIPQLDASTLSLRWLSAFFGGGCSLSEDKLRIVISSDLSIVTRLHVDEFVDLNGIAKVLPIPTNRIAIAAKTVAGKTVDEERLRKSVLQIANNVVGQPTKVPRNKVCCSFAYPDEGNEMNTEIHVPQAARPRKCLEKKPKSLVDILLRRVSVSMTFSSLTGVSVVEKIDLKSTVLWSSNGMMHETALRGIFIMCQRNCVDYTFVKSELLSLETLTHSSWKEHARESCTNVFGNDFRLSLETSKHRSSLFFCAGYVRQCICSSINEVDCWQGFVGDLVRVAREF
jgi:hypothetical protein